MSTTPSLYDLVLNSWVCYWEEGWVWGTDFIDGLGTSSSLQDSKWNMTVFKRERKKLNPSHCFTRKVPIAKSNHLPPCYLTLLDLNHVFKATQFIPLFFSRKIHLLLTRVNVLPASIPILIPNQDSLIDVTVQQQQYDFWSLKYHIWTWIGQERVCLGLPSPVGWFREGTNILRHSLWVLCIWGGRHVSLFFL